jgi:hypothetical protein
MNENPSKAENITSKRGRNPPRSLGCLKTMMSAQPSSQPFQPAGRATLPVIQLVSSRYSCGSASRMSAGFELLLALQPAWVFSQRTQKYAAGRTEGFPPLTKTVYNAVEGIRAVCLRAGLHVAQACCVRLADGPLHLTIGFLHTGCRTERKSKLRVEDSPH